MRGLRSPAQTIEGSIIPRFSHLLTTNVENYVYCTICVVAYNKVQLYIVNEVHIHFSGVGMKFCWGGEGLGVVM